MSNAAPAITLGFQILFGDSKSGMCFFHKQCHVANCRVFYTKSTIGRDNSGEIDEWDVDEWNQFEEKKNWSYLNEFNVIHNSIIKITIPFPHTLDVLPNYRLNCSGFYKNQKCKHIIGKNCVRKRRVVQSRRKRRVVQRVEELKRLTRGSVNKK